MFKNEFLRSVLIKAARILVPSDKLFTKLNYKRKIGRRLNLTSPSYFSEKIQWIKLYGATDLMTKCADKRLVREFVKNRIGEDYLIKCYGCYDNVEKISLEDLPNSFVIQCNHDSTSTKVFKDKSSISAKQWKDTLKFYKHRLKQNYYYFSREKHYKSIKPCVLINEYLSDESCPDGLNDYKIFCFDGKPTFIQVDASRFRNHTRSVFDVDWNLLDTKWCYEHIPNCKRPTNLKEMLAIAEKLSKDFYFVRVDLYSVNNRLYFGELTFTPGSGFEKFEKDEYDLEFGKHLMLPNL